MKKIFLLLFFTFISCNVFAFNIDKAQQNNVVIISQDTEGVSMCNGVVIVNNKDSAIILTAKHCVSEESDLYVEHYTAYILTVSDVYDLALIYTLENIKDKKEANLTYRKLNIYEKVYYWGELYQKEIYLIGRIFQYKNEMILSTMQVQRGCSGGGIWDKNNNLIVIVHAGYFENEESIEAEASLSEGIDAIYNFLINFIEVNYGE